MSHYKSNVRDQVFNLFEVFGVDKSFGEGAFSDLDADTADRVFSLIQRVHASHGLTSILVTHNQELAGRCDRVMRLEAGHMEEDLAKTGKPQAGLPATGNPVNKGVSSI